MARRFSGAASDDYIKLDSDPVGAYPFSVTMWAKPDSSGLNGQQLFSLANGGVDDQYFYINHSTSDGSIAIGARNTTNFEVRGTTNTNDNWHHIAAVWTSATDRKIYVDAVEENSDADSVSYPSITRMALGVLYRSSIADQFKGDIDNFQLWDKGLSQAEIRSIMTRRSPSDPNCKVYWRLDEGTGDSVVDLSQNGNDGTENDTSAITIVDSAPISYPS